MWGSVRSHDRPAEAGRLSGRLRRRPLTIRSLWPGRERIHRVESPSDPRDVADQPRELVGRQVGARLPKPRLDISYEPLELGILPRLMSLRLATRWPSVRPRVVRHRSFGGDANGWREMGASAPADAKSSTLVPNAPGSGSCVTKPAGAQRRRRG